MAKMKTLLESMKDVERVIVHQDITKSNGLSKYSNINIHYYKLIQLFGDPIILSDNSDGKYNWCITVHTSDDEFFSGCIYNDSRYSNDTPIEEVEVWSISAKSNMQAWLIQTIINSPHQLPITIE